MPLSPGELPQPSWESSGGRNAYLARLFDAAWRRRHRLAAWYPWVPVAPARVCSPFTGANGPYPAGALVLLWTYWDFFRGDCPACGGEALGIGFPGSLSHGNVSGICRSCAMVLRRPMRGVGPFMSAIRPVLAGTPFSVNASGLRMGWEPVALVAVLAELGESGLPDPRSSWFSPPWVRKADG